MKISIVETYNKCWRPIDVVYYSPMGDEFKQAEILSAGCGDIKIMITRREAVSFGVEEDLDLLYTQQGKKVNFPLMYIPLLFNGRLV